MISTMTKKLEYAGMVTPNTLPFNSPVRSVQRQIEIIEQ